MKHPRKENRGRPSEKPIEIVRQFTREYDDSIWHYNLDKTDKGPYLVEMTDTTYDNVEKLYIKLEKLKTPQYHENGRKKRTTKVGKITMENAERAYWKEHYKLFPEDRPKKRGRRRTNRINS